MIFKIADARTSYEGTGEIKAIRFFIDNMPTAIKYRKLKIKLY